LKLLILTQYFPPEVGAPQNRLFELAVRLQRSGVEVTVLTAMPNYPAMEIHEDYKGRSYMVEEMDGLKVHRSSIYVSRNKSITSRLRNYFSFVYSSIAAGPKLPSSFDFLLCESPPLFLGYSAMYLARAKKAKLIFNVSDLWPESAERLGVVTNKLLLNLAYRLEAKLYRKSVLVTGQTQGICSDIEKRFPQVKTYWLPNGVDLDYYNPALITESDWRLKENFASDDFIFLYAGIIGLAQGLEIILEAAKEFRSKPHIRFILMGSGPEKKKLVEMKNSAGLNNVSFIDPVPKSRMPYVLKSVNAAIVPLKKLDIFKGAIPSKLFENLAMEIPVLLGVDGEAKTLFIERGHCGLYFEPGNTGALINAIDQLLNDKILAVQLGKNGRKFVMEYFDRSVIASNFHNVLKGLL
jgi:glycosyltransferase involved in cell wall biosynthesis